MATPALPAEDIGTVARLTAALRSLEERRRAGLRPRPDVTFFLGGLDRTLTDEERAYIAMAFAACKPQRDALTVMLERRLAIGRGGVIAAIRSHLGTSTEPPASGGVPQAAVAYLEGLRLRVIAKAARLS